MSSDREEIRWKFQILLDNISGSITYLESERKSIDARYNFNEKFIERLRTKWFAFFGGIITIITPFIILGYLEWRYSFIVISAIIVIIIIWVKTNFGISDRFNQFREIDDKYHSLIKGELMPLKGTISTLALVTDLSYSETELLIKYVSINGEALKYILTVFLKSKLKDVQLDHENFNPYYELAKSSLNDFKNFKSNLKTDIIENFIQEFEKNEKKTKKK